MNYDTALKDLSNLRVFTDFELLALLAANALLFLFSEALDSIPNFSMPATNSKIIFELLSMATAKALVLANN